jgi:hypothetical protein
MRSDVHESFREGNQHFAEVTAPREAVTVDRTPIGTPASLWLETADSVFRWYGAMLRVAFGLGRIDGRGEGLGLIAPPAPVKPEESSRGMNGSGEAQSLIASPALALLPAQSSPAAVAALHSVPSAPAKLRRKRKKTASRGKKGARSSKMSSTKRSHRRAA